MTVKNGGCLGAIGGGGGAATLCGMTIVNNNGSQTFKRRGLVITSPTFHKRVPASVHGPDLFWSHINIITSESLTKRVRRPPPPLSPVRAGGGGGSRPNSILFKFAGRGLLIKFEGSGGEGGLEVGVGGRGLFIFRKH